MNNTNQVFGYLRDIKQDELGLMLSWRNFPSVRENMYTRHIISMDEHLAWWKRTQQCLDQQYFMFEADGVPSGIVAFTGIDLFSRNASWAFYASPDAPKGTGSKMEFLALEQAFTKINLHKLHCEVLAYNTPVIKLHQKFGFKVEGVLREQHRHDNSFVDVIRLGLFASEWLERRIEMQDKLLKFSKG